ncbi:MAG: aldolase [Candidatus Epulonipiscium fishelsonii]|nr:MAG: aldolase [Epulopiscium sp. AS2M-Bin002]
MEDIKMDKMSQAIWIAQSLFNRNKVSGSGAHLSFKEGDKIYITGNNECFGTITEESFSIVDLSGTHIGGIKPSKELQLHIIFYKKSSDIESVIHTNSFYSTLWSCRNHDNKFDCLPEYTPYLKMKLGTVGVVPYAPPASNELFENFAASIDSSDGFLLANHGPIVSGTNLMDAFAKIEELEESCRLAYEITINSQKS